MAEQALKEKNKKFGRFYVIEIVRALNYSPLDLTVSNVHFPRPRLRLQWKKILLNVLEDVLVPGKVRDGCCLRVRGVETECQPSYSADVRMVPGARHARYCH